jgi:TolA-binding protein
MSPKAVQYNANSIIYFQGDQNESVYILKSGKVSLKFKDIETGQELHEMIQTGEFFGVKSALGKYPREETAIVLQNASIISFTVPEFEQLVMKNTRIIMKMLKVFSNQLRRIHKQVRSLLSSEEQGTDPEQGLYSIGDYYMRNKRYPQALYAFRRYLTYYPSGKYAAEVTQKLGQIENKAQSIGVAEEAKRPSSPEQLSGVERDYYDGVSLFSQQKYAEALKVFQNIVSAGGDDEYVAKSIFEAGRCLFFLNQFDKCMKHFTGMIQKYPKHPDLHEALFYVGNCYEKKEMSEKAMGFYKKIISIASSESSAYRKAKKAMRKIEGN